jgi:hypothetical protein
MEKMGEIVRGESEKRAIVTKNEALRGWLNEPSKRQAEQPRYKN